MLCWCPHSACYAEPRQPCVLLTDPMTHLAVVLVQESCAPRVAAARQKHSGFFYYPVKLVIMTVDRDTFDFFTPW